MIISRLPEPAVTDIIINPLTAENEQKSAPVNFALIQ